MKPAKIRGWLHILYAILAFILTVSGLLITFPDIRSKLIGGYGRYLSDIHVWVGWMIILLPIPVFLLTPKPMIDYSKRKLSLKSPFRWAKVNLSFTMISAIIFSVTGILIWVDNGSMGIDVQIPFIVVDIAIKIHNYLTWILIAAVLLHLFFARRVIWAKTKRIFKR